MSSKQLICGDIFNELPKLGKFDCIIADPPDGIGLKYNSFNDKTNEHSYKCFIYNLIDNCMKHSNLAWISFNSKWIWSFGERLDWFLSRNKDWDAKLFINTFTFGQNNKNDCGNGFRPLLRLKHKNKKLYPNTIKVPSWRQLNGDKRATAGGRVPLDVWDFERITGNCKERRNWHPTQLREGMIKRIVNFSTIPGDSILDLFSGTGTVLRAIKDRDITSIEIDKLYCDNIAKEHNLLKTSKNEWQNQ